MDFEIGKWYIDQEGDFIRVTSYSPNYVNSDAHLFKSRGYCFVVTAHESPRNKYQFRLATGEEIIKYLPESEWQLINSELFPIF